MPQRDDRDQQTLLIAAEEVAIAASELSDALYAASARSVTEGLHNASIDKFATQIREAQAPEAIQLQEEPETERRVEQSREERRQVEQRSRLVEDEEGYTYDALQPPEVPPREVPSHVTEQPPQQGEAQGPWALETTTQARLVEIRNALLGQQERADAPKQPVTEGEHKKDDHLGEFLNVVSQPSAGRNQSGSNLGKILGSLRNTINRVRKRAKIKRKRVPTGKSAPSAAQPAEAEAAAPEAAGAAGAAAELGPAGAAAILAIALAEAAKQAYAFARAQEQEVRKLAEFGPTQARAIAQLDANRILRDVQTARETGQSSQVLTDAIDRLETTLRPIEVLLTNLANNAAAGLIELTNQAVKELSDLAAKVNSVVSILEKLAREQAKDGTAFDAIDKLMNEQRLQEKPKWPMGPVGNRRQ